MSAASNYRRSIGLASKQLVQQFVHDSRTDLIKYGPNWQPIKVGSDAPYRYQDVTVNFSAIPVGCTFSFPFESKGQPDEFVNIYAVFDPNVMCQVRHNDVLVAEYYQGNGFASFSPLVRYLDRGTYWKFGDLFNAPSLTLQPVPGLNTLTYTLLPAADYDGRAFYFDGIGYALHGGPKP